MTGKFTARLGTLIGMIALASPALADCNNTPTNRLCDNVQVTQLVTSEDGSNSIRISGNYNDLSCTPNPGGYIRIDMTKPFANILYSHILSAHLQRMPLSIRLSDNISTCTVVYVYSTN